MAKPGHRRRHVERRAAVPAPGGDARPAFAVEDREVAIRAQELLKSWERRVPAAGEPLAEDRSVGFYAFLDWLARAPEEPMLRLLVVVQREAPRRLVWAPMHLPLQYRTLGEAWAELGQTARDEVVGAAGYEQRAQ